MFELRRLRLLHELALRGTLTRLTGLVLEAGGMLSHGACLSREYGLPALTLPNAMQKVPDGATVLVDGDSGRLRVLSDADEVPADA